MNVVEQVLQEILWAWRETLRARLQAADDFTVLRREVAALRAALLAEVETRGAQLDKPAQLQLHARLTNESDTWLLAALERQVELARRDAITGLGNRAVFDARLSVEVKRAARYGRTLSLALLDLDGFKSVNDRWGHPAGDRVLARGAEIMRRSLRVSDAIFRYGGDEFAVLAPETGVCELQAALARLRHNLWLSEAEETRITVSCGVASFPHDAADQIELVRVADARLYDDKRARRPLLKDEFQVVAAHLSRQAS